MANHVVPVKTYLYVWAGLMILLALTIVFDFMDLGWGNTAIAFGIAVTKALLVAVFFMHLYYDERLTWVFAFAGVLWLIILVSYSLTDYVTRGWWTGLQ